MILEEGRGGMIDSFKYRQTLHKLIILGEPLDDEQSAAAQVAAAREEVGKPHPEEVMADAKSLFEQLKANRDARQEDRAE